MTSQMLEYLRKLSNLRELMQIQRIAKLRIGQLLRTVDKKRQGPRLCQITQGGIGLSENAEADAVYDLFDIVGTPEDVGCAIIDALKEGSLDGKYGDYIERSHDLYLNVTIKFCDPSFNNDAEWQDSGEGLWANSVDALEFAQAEVGMEWRLKQLDSDGWHCIQLRTQEPHGKWVKTGRNDRHGGWEYLKANED